MDPTKEIHRSVRAALVGSTDVTDVVGPRVYDAVPPEPTFPYLKVAVGDANEDDDGCGKAWTVSVTVHAWSRVVGTIQAKELNAAIRTALDGVSSATGFAVDYVQFQFARVLDNPDGRTTQGVVNFEIGVSEV